MIEALFERVRAEGRAAFIPYVMAGDPDLATTGELLLRLTALGADAIELGVPYGDPIADGPTIAAAAQRALEGGTRLSDVFALIVRATTAGCAPIVVFTYFNPVYRYGIERFASEAANAGAAGAIVPDVALEESAELRERLAACGLAMPLLVAPSTALDRAKRIAAAASGFVYVVSRLGVTGTGGGPNVDWLGERIATLRSLTGKPLAVGFGVSRPEHAREVAEIADGVIVGSALIDAYAGAEAKDAVARVQRCVEPLIGATRSASRSRV
jgi:tryptophan synthase alpha chain